MYIANTFQNFSGPYGPDFIWQKLNVAAFGNQIEIETREKAEEDEANETNKQDLEMVRFYKLI